MRRAFGPHNPRTAEYGLPVAIAMLRWAESIAADILDLRERGSSLPLTPAAYTTDQNVQRMVQTILDKQTPNIANAYQKRENCSCIR